MRTFALKQKPTQEAKSVSSARRGWAFSGQSHDVRSILHLQRTIGNQAVQRMLQADGKKLEAGSASSAPTSFVHYFSRIPIFSTSTVRVQPKLTVSPPGVMYEEEPDRVPDQVMRMPEPDKTQQQRVGCEKKELQTQLEPWNQTYKPIADQAIQRQIDDPGMQQLQPRGASDKAAATDLFPSGHTMPMWLQIDLGLHNSPPATGLGSRSDPRVHGASATQPVSDMIRNNWYRSPVNPNNPVLVWADGANLFFGPSNAAVTAGRAALPDASFSPPAGYRAVEIQWDRLAGIPERGRLLVIAHGPGVPELVVAVDENLAQVMYSTEGPRHVTREGMEFLEADSTSAPRSLTGAFPDGFFRYRFRGGSDDLYVARGASPAVHLVERSTGTIRQSFASDNVNAVVPETTGVVGVETTTGAPSAAETVSIDLRTSPATITRSAGHATSEAGYAEVRARLEGMGAVIEERGVRFRVVELEAVENALTLGENRGLRALRDFHALPGRSANPVLRLQKMIGPDYAGGTTRHGATLLIQEPFDRPSVQRQSRVRHEMTHIIMEATDTVSRPGMSAATRTALVSEGRRRETAGTAHLGERGLGDPAAAAPSSVPEWRRAVGQDPDMAEIFLDLLETRSFIPDPEGTGDRRGVALADESRYSTAPARAGHPSDNVGEFVASFVTSATVFRTQFEAGVLSAELAGNRDGANAGTDLRRLYERAWRHIDVLYVPLGSNPFIPFPGQRSIAFIRVPSTGSLAQIIRDYNLAQRGIDVAALQRLSPELQSRTTVVAGTVIWFRAREVPALATSFEEIEWHYFRSHHRWPILWSFNPAIRDPASIQPTTRIHLQSEADRAQFGEVSVP